jgi:hypothetical protein
MKIAPLRFAIGMMEQWSDGIMDSGLRFGENSRIDLLPLFIPSIPTFHDSIIPYGFPTWMATKKPYFQLFVEISRHLIKYR